MIEIQEYLDEDGSSAFADWFGALDTQAALKVTTYLARVCLLYTSPSPRDQRGSRMPSSA